MMMNVLSLSLPNMLHPRPIAVAAVCAVTPIATHPVRSVASSEFMLAGSCIQSLKSVHSLMSMLCSAGHSSKWELCSSM